MPNLTIIVASTRPGRAGLPISQWFAARAIDYLHHEWGYKPVGFVSYGGVAAGTRAVQQLKQVVTTLRMLPVFESVNIPFYTQFIDGTARSSRTR
jgi:NAD(P)H-dependent FMN reductase